MHGGAFVDVNELGEQVLGCALKVHRSLGPGLTKAGLEHKRQLTLPVVYDGARIDLGYRLDLLISDQVIVEIKAVDKLTDVHRAQLLSYLKLGGYRVGYLLNFNVKLLKDGICRLINGF
jgi:GxxExxY protein